MNNEQTITLTDEQQNLLNLILQNDEIIFFITEKSKVLAMEINDPKSSWDENAIHKFVMNLCPNNKTPGTTSCNYAGGKTLTFNCTKDNNAVIDLILKNAESMQGDKIGISETYCATNDQLNVLDLFGKMNDLAEYLSIFFFFVTQYKKRRFLL